MPQICNHHYNHYYYSVCLLSLKLTEIKAIELPTVRENCIKESPTLRS